MMSEDAGDPSRSNLVLSVQQLLASVGSMFKSTQVTSVEEALTQLETADEHFQSSDLVQALHRKIDGAVGPLVEGKVENRTLEGDGHNIVAQITDEVFSSHEYNQLYQSFISELRAAVDEMLTDDTLLPTSPHEAALLSPASCSTATQSYSLDDSSASGISYLHQTGLMFMAPDHLTTIAERLAPSQPLQVRLDAMNHLLQFPAADLVSCDSWLSLRAVVRETLMDTDDTLACLSLNFHYCMFAARTSLTTREVYLNLVECLSTYFHSKEGCGVTLAMGLDPADDRWVKLLARYRLLSHFQNEVPSYWVRYSERFMEEIIASTFSLLSLSYSNPSLLGPVHIIALLDTKAAWFRKWMHGQYSRTTVLRVLRSRPTILQGVLSHVLKFNVRSGSKTKRASGELGYYNEQDLHYIHFVHSLCLLERLLLYHGGRKLFSMEAGGRGVTVKNVLVHLLDLFYSLSPVSDPLTPGDRKYDPTLIIAHLLKEIALGNTECRKILCDDAIISTLLAPLKCAMGAAASPRVGQETLLLIADIMAVLASTDNGRYHLLYGQDQSRWTTSRSAPVNTIAEFVVHSLSGSKPPVPPPVTGAWLFVCRQLYNTGEGLLLLDPYLLHMHMARVLKGLIRKEGGVKGHKESADFSWEESLVDNLLNFAGTPKGLLLLQQTGQMARCTQYMDHRYHLKLQVSKCEKFGYGCMVTQVASTAAGITELINSGFVSTLVGDLWTLLDGGEEDYRLIAPRTHPLDPMDRDAHKAVVNLLNLLSSYPALYEVLKQTPPTNTTDTPTTVLELLDRLVLVDSDPKKAALLNYQEAHLFGLRILAVLVTCLDSLLYLETHYSVLDALLALQRENTREDSDLVIVDACSMERNRILVSCYFIGGPTERKIPPHFLTEPSDSYPWPMFLSFPPPTSYHGNNRLSTEQGGELYQFLVQKKCESAQWLERLKSLFLSHIKKKGGLANDSVALLLQRCVLDVKGEAVFPAPQDTTKPLQNSVSMDSLGARTAVRYGQFLGLLDTSPSHVPRLMEVLTTTRAMLATQQHGKRYSEFCSLQGDYTGFDWFSSSVFLLMRGSEEKTSTFLRQFSTLLSAGYIWMPRLHLSSYLPEEVAYSGIHPLTFVTAHHVELILQSEVPLVSSAFRMSGYTPSQICQHWLRQCFWNFLDWSEICLYLATCVVMGTDYQVYYCVSVLKHLEPEILKHTQEQNLLVFLKEESLKGFRCANWLDFMQSLEAKFRTIVIKSMRQFSNT